MNETGTISNISADGKTATVVSDLDGATLVYNDAPISRDIQDGDGVEYSRNGNNITAVVGITEVKIKLKDGATLTETEQSLITQLIKELNKRRGNGGVDIKIKTKDK